MTGRLDTRGRRLLAVALPGTLLAGLALAAWHTVERLETRWTREWTAAQAARVAGRVEHGLGARVEALVRLAERVRRHPDMARGEWTAEARLFLRAHPGYASINRIGPAGNERWTEPASEGAAAVSGELLARARAGRGAVVETAAPPGEHASLTIAVAVGQAAWGGFLAARIDVPAWIDALATGIDPGRLGFALHEGDRVLAQWSPGAARDAGARRHAADTPVTPYGLDWRVRAWPGPDHLAEPRFARSEVVLAVGLAVAALAVLVLEQRERALAHAAAADAAREAMRRELAGRRALEARLEAYLEHAPVAVYFKETDGRFVFVNRRYEAWYGLAPGAAVGRVVADLFPGDVAARHAEDDRRVLEERAIVDVIRPVPHADGREHATEILKFPLLDEAGAVAGIGGFNIDVAQRVEAESRAQIVFDASPSALLAVDPDGVITLSNPQAERLLGRPGSTLVGVPVEALVPARHRGAHVGLRAAFQRAPQTRPMGAGRDLHALRGDGTEIAVEIALSPFVADGRSMTLCSIVDISERKRAEAAYARQAAALERSNEALSRYAYLASHNLQEPLRAVGLNLQLLERELGDDLAAPAREYARRAVDSALRMRTLIQGLLRYSRIAQDAEAPRATDAGRALAAALADLQPAIEETGAVIDAEPLPVVDAVESQLVQVFANLVGNAIEHRGEAPPRVRIAARPVDGMWELSVADEGVGIDPRYHERIFRLFERLDRTPGARGTGLGLAFCKLVVEHGGGTIGVDSRLGEGATFRFTVPASTRQATSAEASPRE